MNLLKFNWSIGQQPKSRFTYEPLADISKPWLTGCIPNDSDFDLGTPSINRREDIFLVATNSSNKRSLEISIKWRPHKDSNLVTVVSKITLVIGEDTDKSTTYTFDQIETYEPQVSGIGKNRISQYGSAGSPFKFFIASPYRRLRVVFRGQMLDKASSGSESFVRFNFVISPVGKIYDFKGQYDEGCLKSQLSGKPYDAVRDLMLFDNHEQPVRLVGELTVNKVKDVTFLWGFIDRQFPEGSNAQMQTKHIRVCLHNGQVFHVGLNEIGSDKVSFGYTGFQIYSFTKPMTTPPTVEWDQIEENIETFRVSVSETERSLIGCEAKLRQTRERFYDILVEGIKGWAHLAIQKGYSDSTEFSRDIEKSRDAYLQAKGAGMMAQSLNLDEIGDEPVFVGLRESACTCAALVGAKASSLAQLSSFVDKCAENYQVPNGLVLTKFAHDILLDQNPTIKAGQDALQALLVKDDFNASEVRLECEKLQKLVEESQLPENIQAQLAEAIKNKLDKGVDEACFAVRSSSWGEDEEDMSAAGQLSTILNVKGLDHLSKAVMACLASKFAYTCVEYRRQHGLTIDLPMAVVVQEMVACEKAGVMFTCDPTSGDSRLLTITANYGLGESVVSGQSEPDSIQVRRELNGEIKIEAIEIGAKKIVLGVDNADSFDRSKCCLSDDEIIRLAKLGLAMVDYYRGPRDIEWGYKQGQLYLFQSRPVTGIDSYSEIELIHENDKPGKAESEFSTRANIGEVMPYAIKPLTLTSVVNFWNLVGYRLYTNFSHEFDYTAQCCEEVYYDSYHSIFNLRCSGFLTVDSEMANSTCARAMQVGFFGREVGFQPDIAEATRGIPKPESLFEGFYFDLYTWALRKFPMSIVMREKRTMAQLRKDLRSLKLATGYQENKLLSLYNQFNTLPSYNIKAWQNHILLIVVGNFTNMGLLGLMSKYISEPIPLFSALNKFLALSQDVISAQIPARIEAMTDLIKSKGTGEVEAFMKLTTEQSIAYIEQGDQELSKLFSEFMELFGHRCYNEFEICGKSWREDPERVIEMLKTNCKATNKMECKRPSTIDEVIDSLGVDFSLKDRLVIKYILVPKCQLMVAVRERTKDILVENADILREGARMLAVELRRQMRIPDEDLMYYLCLEELDAIVREPQPALVAQASRRRAMFRKVFKEPWKFDEIIRGHHLLPNHMLPARELDEKLASAPRLMGTPASSGRVQAKVCLIHDYTELDRVRPGDILLTHSTDIAFSPVFPLVVGIITEVGGLISHGAVVAREYGLPAVLGIPDITRILQDGEEIVLDADTGTIIRLGMQAEAS